MTKKEIKATVDYLTDVYGKSDKLTFSNLLAAITLVHDATISSNICGHEYIDMNFEGMKACYKCGKVSPF